MVDKNLEQTTVLARWQETKAQEGWPTTDTANHLHSKNVRGKDTSLPDISRCNKVTAVFMVLCIQKVQTLVSLVIVSHEFCRKISICPTETKFGTCGIFSRHMSQVEKRLNSVWNTCAWVFNGTPQDGVYLSSMVNAYFFDIAMNSLNQSSFDTQ